jgi:hypothetical protein
MAPGQLRYRHLVTRPVDPYETSGRSLRLYAFGWYRPAPPPWRRELDHVEEGVGSVAQIVALLQARRLFLGDLVDVGRGWESVDQCDELRDACARLRLRELLTKVGKATTLGLLFLALALLGWWLLARYDSCFAVGVFLLCFAVLGWLFAAVQLAFDRLRGVGR